LRPGDSPFFVLVLSEAKPNGARNRNRNGTEKSFELRLRVRARRIQVACYVSNDEYDKFLRKAALDTGGIKSLVWNLGLTYNLWQAKPWPLADKLHPTEWVVAQSRKVLEQADAKRPLFLTTSFCAPHPPLFPPKKYFDAYAEQKLPSPAHGDWVRWDALSPRGDRS